MDKRRSDLAGLVLSQNNMDKQQSVLSLMNNLLSQQIRKSLNLSNEGAVQEMLSTYRLPVRNISIARIQPCVTLCLQMSVIADSPMLAQVLSSISLLSPYNEIYPDLYVLLVEDITEDLIKKNFGNIEVQSFFTVSHLMKYYGLDSDSLAFL